MSVDFQVPSWQAAMWGEPRRLVPWQDVIGRIITQIGDRPDLTESEYNRKIAAIFYSELPAMAQSLEAIIKKGDIEYGKKLIAQFFQLPAAQVPAPDTIARDTRRAKEELRNAGQLTRISHEHEESFNELLAQVEEETGNYNSSIEARFKLFLNNHLPNYRWEENKALLVQSGVHQGRRIIPDILCEKLGVSIEIDSLEFHNGREQFISDRQKARIMQDLGYYHLQFSGPELSIPNGFHNALEEIKDFIGRHCKE